MKHILVLDDDAEIRELLADYLERNGLRVTTLADGRDLFRCIDESCVDLLVLDVMVPGDDGLTLCRNLRARSRLPVLMLSARGEEVDRIVGLEMGADDYVAKPFSPRELLARINAILKRAERPEPPPTREYRFDGYRLDMLRRVLTCPDGLHRALTGAEFELLNIFLARPNRVLSREHLVEITQGREAPAYDRSIDVRVSRLRQTLSDKGREMPIIRTVYGEGYIFTAMVEQVPLERHEAAVQ